MAIKLKTTSGWSVVANSGEIDVDSSLSIEGKAADAAAVGNEIDRVEALISSNIDTALSNTSTNPVQNKVITTALAEKQVSGNYITADNTELQSIVSELKVAEESVYFSKGELQISHVSNPTIELANSNATFTMTAQDDKLLINGLYTFDQSGNMIVSGNVQANTFTGSGANITALNANNITSGVLPLARGGTGLIENPSILVNLASENTANVFTTSPRPGVTGTLRITNGGTGGTDAQTARDNLGIGNVGTLTYTEVTF